MMDKSQKVKELEAIRSELLEIQNELDGLSYAEDLKADVASIFITLNNVAELGEQLCDYYDTIYSKSNNSLVENILNGWLRQLKQTDRIKEINELDRLLRYDLPSVDFFIESKKENISETENYWNSCFSHEVSKGKYVVLFITPKDYGDVEVQLFKKAVSYGHSGTLNEVKKFSYGIPKFKVEEGTTCVGGDVFFRGIVFPTQDFSINVYNEKNELLKSISSSIERLKKQNIYDFDLKPIDDLEYRVKILSAEGRLIGKEEFVGAVNTITIDSYQYTEGGFIDETYAGKVVVQGLEFPVVKAILYHQGTGKQVISLDEGIVMKKESDFYTLNLKVPARNHEPHGEYYWKIEGPYGEKLTTKTALTAGIQYYPELVVTTKAIKPIPVDVNIDFMPTKVGLLLSNEAIRGTMLGTELTAAKFNPNSDKNFKYSKPRSGEGIYIMGKRDVEFREGELTDKGEMTFSLRDREHYFEYYSITIKSTDSDFTDGNQIEEEEINAAVRDALNRWALSSVNLGIELGITNVFDELKKQDENIDWWADLIKGSISIVCSVIDVSGDGIASVVGDALNLLIDLSKDSFKPKKPEKASLIQAGADMLDDYLDQLTSDLNDSSSDFYRTVWDYVDAQSENGIEQKVIVNTLTSDLQEELPSRESFTKAIVDQAKKK